MKLSTVSASFLLTASRTNALAENTNAGDSASKIHSNEDVMSTSHTVQGAPCSDSPTWEKSKGKTCDWVADQPYERCKKRGIDKTRANASCQDACNTCSCKDSSTWYKKGSGFKTCDWVQKKIIKRCKKKGVDGTKAKDNCRLACGTCIRDNATSSPTLSPTTSPTASPTTSPTTPNDVPNSMPSTMPSIFPSGVPSDLPSSQSSGVPSVLPSIIPSALPSVVPSSKPSTLLSNLPTISSNVPRAAWMSQKHGIGYRLPGGTNYASWKYNATEFAEQIKDTPISYVIVGLSSGASGDRYLSPCPIFNLAGIRANTPKDMDLINYNLINPESKTVDLGQFDDIDVFDDILAAMDKINVNVIAYMGAQGPAMLKAGEAFAFDHPSYAVGKNTGGYLVDNSITVCESLGATAEEKYLCAPSVRKWVNWVAQRYNISDHLFSDTYVTNSPLQVALKDAYANILLDHYAKHFGIRIAGFWFDQGMYGDKNKIIATIRKHNPNAVIAYNYGAKIPLRNNNPTPSLDSDLGEDFTFGHMTPHKSGANPPDGCYNYGMVLSAESSSDGYVYNSVSPSKDLSQSTSNPYTSNEFLITYEKQGSPSLAHVYLPFQEFWNSGNLIWNERQAAEWMYRVINSKGAFTWAVRRAGCAGCSGSSQSLIEPDDFEILKRIYKLLPITDSLQFNSTNCDCLAEFEPSLGWGCAYNPPSDECKNYQDQNGDDWEFPYSPTKYKNCGWVCKGFNSRCLETYIGTDGVNAKNACKSCCDSDCVSAITDVDDYY